LYLHRGFRGCLGGILVICRRCRLSPGRGLLRLGWDLLFHGHILSGGELRLTGCSSITEHSRILRLVGNRWEIL
jgi:hypothetical protein